MIWVCAGLAALLLLDALRVRVRLASLAVLEPSGEGVSSDHRFLLAPGVVLDDQTRRAASAYARAHGLALLDLLPRDLPVANAMGILQIIDPRRLRADPFGRGVTAGQALLASTDLLQRAGVGGDGPSNPLEFLRTGRRLRRFAGGAADLAIAPRLRATAMDPSWRRAVLREILGSVATVAALLGPAIVAVIGVGLALAPPFGAIALVSYHLQPLVGLGGRRLQPRDLLWVVLFRSALDLWSAIYILLGPRRQSGPDPVERLRPLYDSLLAGGLERFFEPRAARCPVCDSGDLSVRLRTTDLVQHKPGRFTLERCAACGHVFQNPRLSLEGLDFYYRDFYDGLGESAMDAVFGASPGDYFARARLVAAHGHPQRWLDVGAGHGHFARAAREVFPETRFDGLDLSESIEEAARAGWVERAHRGFLPELAPSLSGAYDVASMSHYLEHTRDPRAEIAAAAEVLKPGGLLLIEVPDPSSRLGRLLGRYWIPWFQPQHQHFFSIGALERLLRAEASSRSSGSAAKLIGAWTSRSPRGCGSAASLRPRASPGDRRDRSGRACGAAWCGRRERPSSSPPGEWTGSSRLCCAGRAGRTRTGSSPARAIGVYNRDRSAFGLLVRTVPTGSFVAGITGSWEETMGNRLYVGNLPYQITEDELRALFGEEGRQVIEVKIVTDAATGQPRGFGFVELAGASQAQAAIAALNGREVGGRRLVVSEAHDRPRGRGGGRDRR
jgi:SAM-dependent methyltransferase